MSRLRSLANDLGWKLAAVVCAYALWLVVVEEKQALAQLEVPVRFDNQSPGLALVGERASSVIIRVQAAEGIVKQLQSPDVDVRIDLTGRGEGSHNIPLRPDSPEISPRRVGVKIVEVFPSQMKVTLERKVTAEIPVSARLVGTPADGYEYQDVTITPPAVSIVGPQSAVEATTEALTREISLEGRRAPFEQEVLIDVESPDILITSEQLVLTAVKVGETLRDELLSGVAVEPLRSEYESRVRPSGTDVTLRGPARLLDRLEDSDVVTFVDLKGLEPRPEAYRLKVEVTFSRDQYRRRIEVTEISNDEVSVRIYDRKLQPAQDPEGHGG